MDRQGLDWGFVLTALVAGIAIFAFLSWKPVASRINILNPENPEKALRIFFLIVLGLWVLVGVAMSIGVMFNIIRVVN